MRSTTLAKNSGAVSKAGIRKVVLGCLKRYVFGRESGVLHDFMLMHCGYDRLSSTAKSEIWPTRLGYSSSYYSDATF